MALDLVSNLSRRARTAATSITSPPPLLLLLLLLPLLPISIEILQPSSDSVSQPLRFSCPAVAPATPITVIDDTLHTISNDKNL